MIESFMLSGIEGTYNWDRVRLIPHTTMAFTAFKESLGSWVSFFLTRLRNKCLSIFYWLVTTKLIVRLFNRIWYEGMITERSSHQLVTLPFQVLVVLHCNGEDIYFFNFFSHSPHSLYHYYAPPLKFLALVDIYMFKLSISPISQD